MELIHFKEILIASIGLLAVPKSVQINIEEFMGNSKLLPIFPDRALNKSRETAERLNNVSDTIQEMAKSYKIEKSQIEIPNTIQSLGFHNININLYPGIISIVKVHVIK